MKKCEKCGRVWPDAVVDDWGVGRIGDGLGPEPVCPGLNKARGSIRGAPDPQEACKGRLVNSGAQEDTGGTALTGRPIPQE